MVNHTFDHQSFTGASTGTRPLSTAQRLAELDRADVAIRTITGAGTVGWMRPPYGDRDSSVDTDVAAAGYRYELMWTVDSLGWKGTPAADVAARCLARAEPGAIFLFHVGDASTDADALGAILSGLRRAGYAFATVTEMIGG